MFLAKDERKREKTVQNEPARNRTLEPQRATGTGGISGNAEAGGHPGGLGGD